MTSEIKSQFTSSECYQIGSTPYYIGHDDHQTLLFTFSKFKRDDQWQVLTAIGIMKECLMKESYNPSITLLEFEGRRSCRDDVEDNMVKGDLITEVIQIKVQDFFDFYQKEYPLLCFKFKVVQVNPYSEKLLEIGPFYNQKGQSNRKKYQFEGTVSLRIENCLTFIDHKNLEKVADLHFKFRQKNIGS